MTKLQQSLLDQGIYPFGTDELRINEERLNRYFTREYERWITTPKSLDECGVRTDTGDMWEETGDLISNHYDEQLVFFKAFLDHRYRAYSMAYYNEDPIQALRCRISLEQAQSNKFRLISERIGITGTERILNIGCGFGSFEQYLIERFPNIELVSITPSQVQTHYLQRRINTSRDIFSKARLEIVSADFGTLPTDALGAESFDLVCSIGLLEQVKNMQKFFAKVSCLLKPNGKTFHHFITSRFVIPQFLNAKNTLISDYFPGGRIWPFDEMARHEEYFTLENSWFINGMNYWRTLDEWHRRYWENIDQLSASLGVDRIRHWNNYFSLCKACFYPLNGSVFGNGHYLFRKK